VVERSASREKPAMAGSTEESGAEHCRSIAINVEKIAVILER
jgi:hypothetical protein